MNIAVLALVGIVLILGLVAFAIGTGGWNWGTVTAAFLVLLSSVAFVYLAARVLERERVWGERVRGLEAQLVRARDAEMPDADGHLDEVPGERSLAILKTELERWKRARARSETWRGRFWEGGEFQPPRLAENGGPTAPGTLRFELADEEAEVPIAAGAQIFVFDDADVEDGGRYLGAFRVEASARDGDQFRLTVVPALAQSPSDVKLWSKAYESVTAFERLPSDSWLAFSRTSQPAAEGEKEEADGEIIPATRKMSAENLLETLESRLAEVERHDVPVAEDEWRPLVDEKKIPPGMYWATVEFKGPYEVKPVAAGEAREPVQFEPGDTAEFGLESVVEFVNEANELVVDIKRVVYRRPLTDAATALQGGAVAGAGGATIRADGLIARRTALERQVAEIQAAVQSLAAGLEKSRGTLTTLRSEEGELVADVERWRKDAAAAVEVAKAFHERSLAAGRALDEAWGIVVQRGREYDGTMTLLQAELDKRAPAPR
jgi:hypothetical protein